MLVLTRKVGERLVIGDRIVVTIVQIEGGRIRVGIEAPAEVPIVRSELTAHAADAGGRRAGALPASR